MRLIEQLRWWAAECDRTNFGCQARKLLLEAAEASEKAKPVKKGRWLQPKSGECFCSECKTNGSPQWERCPVCEAKMDGGDAE